SSRGPKNAAEDRVDLGEMKVEVEIGGKLCFAQIFAHFRIGLEQRQEIALAAPGFHGVALDQAIGVFAPKSLLREREQDALGMNQTAEAVEVFPHVLRIDDQLVDDPGE